jgi:uncharacterized RDD family membrane protein YckC
MDGTLFCTKCGAPNAASAQFCSRCGATTGTAVAPISAPISTPTPIPAPGYPAAGYPPAYQAGGYPQVQAGARYGGFWVRVLAAIVDTILIRLVVAPVGIIFGLGGLTLGGLGHRGFGDTDFEHGGMLLALLGGGVMLMLVLCVSWIYEALMESSSYQATLGKMIFGMRVTDLYGNRISFARATGRHFAKILSGMILCIGFIMVGLSERKQGLHDLLAGTLVRRT